MFRTLEDCVETLEEAKSGYWTIKGQGTEIKHEPDGEATLDAAIMAFQKAYGRLGHGIYTLEHWKNANTTRGRQSFRFNKAPEAPAGVAGPGGDVHTYLQLHQEIANLKHQRELDEQQRRHENELRTLKEKLENQGGNGTDKFMNIVGSINQLFQNQARLQGLNGRAVVAGAPTPPSGISAQAGVVAQPPADLPADDVTADAELLVNQLVSGIHQALGNDDAATMGALRKLAAKATENPGQIKTLLNFI